MIKNKVIKRVFCVSEGNYRNLLTLQKTFSFWKKRFLYILFFRWLKTIFFNDLIEVILALVMLLYLNINADLNDNAMDEFNDYFIQLLVINDLRM